MWWMNRAWRELLYPGQGNDFFKARPMLEIESESKQYVQANALFCAELSRLVYRHDIEEDALPRRPTRREYLERNGCDQLAFFQDASTHTQAMLVRHRASQLRILVFRGTEQDIRDFVTDADVGTLPLLSTNPEQVLVHRGFERGLNSIWQAIQAKLVQEQTPIWVTGHSLGGALAILACGRFEFSCCYTFGAPRVGNQAFVNSLKFAKLFRVVNDQDVICNLPIEAMGFVHAGQAIVLARQSKAFNPMMLLSPVKPLYDHAPRNYVLAL